MTTLFFCFGLLLAAVPAGAAQQAPPVIVLSALSLMR